MSNKFIVVVLDSVWKGDIFDTPSEPVIRGLLSREADIRVFFSPTIDSPMREEIATGLSSQDFASIDPDLILINLDRSIVRARIGPRVVVSDNLRLLRNIRIISRLVDVPVIGYTNRGLSSGNTKKLFGSGLSRILDIGVLRILNPDNEALFATI